MKILILEDNAERIKYFKQGLIGHEVTVTEFSKEAIEYLKKERFDVLFLDHDLGGRVMVASGEDTGYAVAKFLSMNTCRMPGKVILHTFNSVGCDNMMRVLPKAVCVPGVWLKLDKLFKKEGK